MNKVNKELYTNNQHQFFLTLFLGVLNVKTGTLNFCNAAHTPSLILKASGEIIELGHSHGLPLGLYPNKEYSEGKVKIEKGDSIILYTDGITEAQDENNKHLGVNGLKKIVGQLKTLSAEEMVKGIEKSVIEFRGESKQTDDICLLVLKYNP